MTSRELNHLCKDLSPRQSGADTHVPVPRGPPRTTRTPAWHPAARGLVGRFSPPGPAAGRPQGWDPAPRGGSRRLRPPLLAPGAEGGAAKAAGRVPPVWAHSRGTGPPAQGTFQPAEALPALPRAARRASKVLSKQHRPQAPAQGQLCVGAHGAHRCPRVPADGMVITDHTLY